MNNRSGPLPVLSTLGHDGAVAPSSAPPPSTARLARRRARDEIVREIVETARRHLAVDGAAGLSLRAVARDLGMVSSAVYRYVPSRDDLLTRLIVEAYDALGAAAEKAEAKVDRDDLLGRLVASCSGARRWALKHPHEYALLYGSPVPGYAAPQDTVAPATRVPVLLITVLFDGVRSGRIVPDDFPALSETVRRAIAPLRGAVPEDLPEVVLVQGMIAWTYLFGAISFELFGHRHQVVADAPALREAFFEAEITRVATLLGLGSEVP